MIEKRIFTGGMNRDDAYSVLSPEDYISAFNIRITDDRNGATFGRINPVEGNARVLSPLPSGSYRTICALEDTENDHIYYFVTGDGDYIVKYTGTSWILLDGSDVEGGLNFSKRIHSAVLVNDTIYWTDNYNQPRAFHLNRTYATPIRQEDLTLIKRGPKLPLQVGKISSASSPLIEELTNNFIGETSFQFAYRYIYNEYQYSVLSPFSKLITHNIDEEDFDAVYISIPSAETIPNGVRSVQLLARNGNSGSFYIIDTFDIGFEEHNAGDVIIDTVFTNDTRGIAISDEIAYKLFDSVPLKSETIEAARNRLFLGNNLIGYDAPSIIISAEAENSTIGPSAVEGEYILLELIWEEREDSDPVISYEFREFYLIVKVPSGEFAGYHQVQIVGNPSNAFYSQTLPPSVLVSADTFVLAIDNDLEGYYVDNFIPDDADNGRAATNFNYPGQQPTVVGGDADPATTSHFKSNSWYRLGIVFYDNEGRSPGVCPDTVVTRTVERQYLTSQFTTAINWSIESDPELIPDWATHYQIVRTKNQTTSFFVQSFIYKIKYVEKTDGGDYELADNYVEGSTVGLAFDVSNLFRDGLGYSFQAGDLITYCPPSGENITLKVEDIWGKYVIGEYRNIGDLSDGTSNPNAKCLIEIYTPYRSSDDEFFYEVGEAFPIEDGDFSITSGRITGDCFLVERQFDDTDLLTEAMNRNDKYWQLWHTDVGRSSIIVRDDGQKRLPTNIAYSNTFVQGTRTNGLNSFELLDYTNLDERHGSIKKLVLTSRTQQYGTVMLAVCTQDTASIYLGETQVVDNSDNAILATSGNVIGTINTLKGGYGTRHPESVVENEGNVYWFDQRNGKVIRYNINGLIPISDYKMSTFWRTTSQQRFGEYVAGYDSFNEEYLLSIPGNYVAAFSEKINRWTSFYRYTPEAYAVKGLTLVSFKDGDLWEHNDSFYSTFYAKDESPSFSFIVNGNYSYERKYTNMHIEGTVTPETVSFRTYEPNSQYSVTYGDEIVKRDSVYYVPIFRDVNSPNLEGTTDEKRLKGEFMEGRFLQVGITFPLLFYWSVYSLGIKMIENFGHPVVVKQEI